MFCHIVHVRHATKPQSYRLPMEWPHVWECWFWNPGHFCLWNPESWKFVSWNREFWALQSGIQLKESGIPLKIAIRNPSSTDKESGIHGVESRIQDFLTFRYIGRNGKMAVWTHFQLMTLECRLPPTFLPLPVITKCIMLFLMSTLDGPWEIKGKWQCFLPAAKFYKTSWKQIAVRVGL